VIPTMYEGTIRHRRFAVTSHEFRHRIALAYADLDAPPRGRFLDRAAIEALVERRPATIRLLTMPRSLGVGFNPVSFYYCFDDGQALTHVVAEVTNTPWGERHTYVLPQGQGSPEKAFHVSPFMGMDHGYDVRATAPAETLSVHIASHREGALAFDATLLLQRRPYSRFRLLGASIRTLTLIYAHALALKLKGAPYFPHPRPEAL
jgi:uncharacterized protein